ncbi:FAA hydrolase family protein [Ornithinibacillus sp. L9]|uniref:FAA hydrolase family protein n=1 Tax=Ornithinibacillus caprae TaxID=2678566 RepID=A0A6N8FHB4_9BACI|nr:fumarylacetoacetate hydrolase family protein [Ornithinibacillus caprae]MUK88611.1 FAA hydrolase family protein [Ornithinibacillus caprae]
MKLVSYKLKQKPSTLRVGFVMDDKIIDVQEAFLQLPGHSTEMEYMLPSEPNAFYKIGIPAIEKAKKAYTYVMENQVEEISFHRDEVYVATPIPEPSKIICVGKNYAEHAAEMKSEVPDYPVLFAKFANALVGPEDQIVKNSKTNKLDYEVELTVIIGKEASNVTQEDALNYVAGYTIGNDGSARDLQKRTPQWLQGKSLDNSTPVGPWIVTADEVGDPSNLDIHSRVNGELRQSSNTSKLIFDIPYLISFISSLMTLKPGDMILTGTPDGVGFALNPPQFLKGGDKVQLEIEKIGRMENEVIEGEFHY